MTGVNYVITQILKISSREIFSVPKIKEDLFALYKTFQKKHLKNFFKSINRFLRCHGLNSSLISLLR